MHAVTPRPAPPEGFPGNATARNSQLPLEGRPSAPSTLQSASSRGDYETRAGPPLVGSESGTGLKKESNWLAGQKQTVNPKRPTDIVSHCRLSWQVLTGPRWRTGCSPVLPVTTSPYPVRCVNQYITKPSPTTPAPPKLPTANMIQSEGDSNQRKPKQTQEFLLRPTVKSVGRWNLFFLVCIYVVTVNQTTHGLGGGGEAVGNAG